MSDARLPQSLSVEDFPVTAATGGARLRLLPSFELTSGGAVLELPLGAQRVLAFLALRERAVLRTHVAGVLWADTTEQRASASLRSAVWRVRRLAQPVVDASASHLRLASSVAVDLREAEAHARGLFDSDLVTAPDVVGRSLSSDLLCDWYEDWVLLERERFRQLRLHALELLCERLTAAGRFAAAVEAGLAAVAGEPLRESAQRALIKAHLAEGNQVEAFRQYSSYSDCLARELGAAPSPSLERLLTRASLTAVTSW